MRRLPCSTKSSTYASLAQRESISLTRRGLGYRNSHGAPHMGHGDAQGVYRTCNAEIRGEHYPYGPPFKIKRQRGPVEEIANIARIAVHRARYGISSHSRYTKCVRATEQRRLPRGAWTYLRMSGVQGNTLSSLPSRSTVAVTD